MIHDVQLTDDLYWLSQCLPVDGAHMHLSQYLLAGTEDFVLVDAGVSDQREMKDALSRTTENDGVDTVLLTHSIMPHTATLDQVRDEYDDPDVVSASIAPNIVGLPDFVERKIVNATEQRNGLEFTFLDPLLTDVVVSNWIYNREHGVLFTAEGVGHYHPPGECTATSSDRDIELDDVHAFNRDNLPYLKFVDPEKLRAGFDAVFDRFDVELIAPTRGSPVVGDDIETYVDTLIRSAARFGPDTDES